jgi:hypothetical protein
MHRGLKGVGAHPVHDDEHDPGGEPISSPHPPEPSASTAAYSRRDADERHRILQQIAQWLGQHAEMEEKVLYPLMTEALGGQGSGVTTTRTPK